MKRFIEWIKSFMSPKSDGETKREIISLNINNIYYVSLVVGIVQTVSLIFFIIFNTNSSGDGSFVNAVIRVGLSIVLCAVGFFVAGKLKKSSDAITKHTTAVKVFIGSFVVSLITWSMFVSVSNYVNNQQLLTFYTVELLAVMFVKLNPAFSTTIILGSYTINYLILTLGFGGGRINLYNYLMLGLLSVAGALLNYRLTVNYISEKNKANMLNESLEIIANHDSITRLQNRYALNQHVPDYIGQDICIAMGDINSFKAVNDTFGHRAGDDVLKTFADILLEFFSKECVYRYGGDEFLIIQSDIELEAFLDKLSLVNKRFSATKVEGVTTGLGCSFGCVRTRPVDTADLFDQLTKADKKLYEEKQKINQNRI